MNCQTAVEPRETVTIRVNCYARNAIRATPLPGEREDGALPEGEGNPDGIARRTSINI